jgi:hypothetical protein
MAVAHVDFLRGQSTAETVASGLRDFLLWNLNSSTSESSRAVLCLLRNLCEQSIMIQANKAIILQRYLDAGFMH